MIATLSRTATLSALLVGTTVFTAGCGTSDRDADGTSSRPRQKPEVSAEIPEKLVSLVDGLYANVAADRAHAAVRLRQLGPAARPAVPYLVDLLSDPSWQVRREAAEALGALGDGQAVAPLIEVLENRDGDWSVRAATARSLGRLGDARAVEALGAVLNDMNAHVRHMAAIALGRIGTPETAEPLVAAARSDSDAAVRFSAAQAIRY